MLALAGLTIGLLACGSDDDDPAPADPAVTNPTPPPITSLPTTPGAFTTIVSFGDSLSDAGTYAPATSVTGDGQPPYIGGRFTNNSATSRVWVEHLAADLSIPATPAVVGFGPVSTPCPAALIEPAAATHCTLYGQGGSRVTEAAGIGNENGALTEPMKAQIDRHLASFTRFTASDLVFVYGGNNDAFAAFGGFTAAAQAIAAGVAGGTITPEQAQAQQGEALAAAQAVMSTAATELVGYIRNDILGNGANYVAVMTLPDSAQTPFGASLPDSVRPVLTAMVDTFNATFREGIAALPVLLVDANALAAEVAANPAIYGFTNSTEPACDAQIIAAVTQGVETGGSSLFCSSEPGSAFYSLRAGATETTYQFADGVHPTTGAHKKFEEQVRAQLTAAGWLAAAAQ